MENELTVFQKPFYSVNFLCNFGVTRDEYLCQHIFDLGT